MGFGQIVEHGPGRADRLGVGRAVGEAKPFQARGAEVLGERLPGRLPRKRPTPGRRVIIIRSFSRGRGGGVGSVSLSRHSAGAIRANWSANCRRESRPRRTGPVESSTQARPAGSPGADGRQVIALARIQQGVVGHGAGRDDPRHLAPHQALGQLGVFDLLADRRPHAGGDQLAQVAFQLVMGKAGHGDGVLALFAAGQGQVQHAGGRLGVVVEHLVEVAHPKQQQRIRDTPFFASSYCCIIGVAAMRYASNASGKTEEGTHTVTLNYIVGRTGGCVPESGCIALLRDGGAGAGPVGESRSVMNSKGTPTSQ